MRFTPILGLAVLFSFVFSSCCGSSYGFHEVYNDTQSLKFPQNKQIVQEQISAINDDLAERSFLITRLITTPNLEDRMIILNNIRITNDIIITRSLFVGMHSESKKSLMNLHRDFKDIFEKDDARLLAIGF